MNAMTRRTIALSMQRLRLAISAVAAIATLTNCGTETRPPPSEGATGGDGFVPRLSQRDGGSETECADHEQPGCPCDTEGAHLQCGKVVAELHDQVVCGTGVSV